MFAAESLLICISLRLGSSAIAAVNRITEDSPLGLELGLGLGVLIQMIFTETKTFALLL